MDRDTMMLIKRHMSTIIVAAADASDLREANIVAPQGAWVVCFLIRMTMHDGYCSVCSFVAKAKGRYMYRRYAKRSSTVDSWCQPPDTAVPARIMRRRGNEIVSTSEWAATFPGHPILDGIAVREFKTKERAAAWSTAKNVYMTAAPFDQVDLDAIIF